MESKGLPSLLGMAQPGGFVMDIQGFTLQCTNWDGSREQFAQIVNGATAYLGLTQVDLARIFQVSGSTISRWAKGHAEPHPRVQQYVVATVRKRATGLARSHERMAA